MSPAVAAVATPGVPSGEPTPCLGCGAPMVLSVAYGLHESPELRCDYCWRREALPHDAAERHRHLRLRLMQLQRAREATEGPLRAYRAMKGASVPALVIMGLLAVGQLSQAGDLIRAGVPLLQSLFGVVLFVGVGAGWLGMVLTFRRLVRPLMLARPPGAGGAPARCRSCGGNLPALRSASVPCGYCGAENLLDASLTRSVSALLLAEAEEYRARALGTTPDPNRYDAPARAFYVWAAVAALVSALLVQGAQLLSKRTPRSSMSGGAPMVLDVSHDAHDSTMPHRTHDTRSARMRRTRQSTHPNAERTGRHDARRDTHAATASLESTAARRTPGTSRSPALTGRLPDHHSSGFPILEAEAGRDRG